MSSSRLGPHNLQGLPTLTEVIELPPGTRDAVPGSLSSGAVPAPAVPAHGSASEPGAAPASERHLVDRVLTDLQRNAELMLEARLREALTPALARLADSLVSDVRLEFAAALRDMVEQTVSQELARQRSR